MRALVYNGPRDVSVQQVPDAKVEHPTDAVIRVTATNICGSDLHMYEGRTDLETGMVIGHENLGEVVEVGAGVTKLSVGDRVVLPFNIGCGFCENCEQGRTGFCLTVNPGVAGGAYGFAGMGGYSGGQAEYLRVPFADFNALQLPEDSVEKENDYVMLADIFPTGWHGTRLAKVAPGDSVTVYGGGPVGLMAGYSAVLQGASEVYVIDHLAERLALAEEFGAIGINSSTGDPIEQIKDATKGRGTDRGVEAIGYQAHDSQGVEQPNMTMNGLVEVVKATGTIGVVGLFLPEDPGERPGQREELQPRAGPAHPPGQGHPGPPGQPQPGSGRGARGLPALRRPRPGLDEGRPQPHEGLRPPTGRRVEQGPDAWLPSASVSRWSSSATPGGYGC
ncbi:glutathione-independent formaldehyde dehydrogenase [Klenkia terrae]